MVQRSNIVANIPVYLTYYVSQWSSQLS